jgi:hypothetical protein
MRERDSLNINRPQRKPDPMLGVRIPYWNPLKVLDYTARTGLVLNEAGGLNGAIIPSCALFNGTDDQMALSGGVKSYSDSIEIEFTAKCTATIASNVLLSMLYAGGSDYVCLRSATTLRVAVGGTLLAFARPTNDKLWHTYKIRFIQGATTTVRLYIDGTESTTGVLDIGSVKPFKLGWLSGTGSYGFPGSMSYVKITNTGTSAVLNHWILTGHGLYNYDIVGDQTLTLAGTGTHYSFDAVGSTYLLDSGWTEWQKAGLLVEYVPLGGDTSVLSDANYIAKRFYDGSATGYNKAPSLLGFNETSSDNALLTHFDRSNETIQTAASRSSVYYSTTSLATKSRFHCSELEYDTLASFFNTGYKNKFFATNNVIGISTLISAFALYEEDVTGSALTKLKTTTKSIAVTYPEFNYYVSNTGNDDNDGLTITAPLLTVAKINALPLVPNTNILFKRGDIWRETIVISKDGVVNYPITYKDYGTGDKPIISGADIQTGFSLVSGSYDVAQTTTPNVVLINGVRGTYKADKASCTENGDWAWTANVLSVKYGSDPSDITQASIRNNCVNGDGDYTAFENLHFEGNKTFGISFLGINNEISYCDFENIGGRNVNCAGIYVQNDDMNISYCTFTDIEHTGIRGFSGNNVLVSHNTFDNCWNGIQYPDGGEGGGVIAAGQEWEISYNTATDCYRGISVIGTAGTIVHHNITVNSKVNSIDHGAGATEALPNLIYNNTIIHNPGNTAGHGLDTQGEDANYVKFKNNLVYVTFTGTNTNVQGMTIGKDDYLDIDTDYNIVYKVAGSTADLYILESTICNTLGEWQTALAATSYQGKALHDINADPLFTNFAGGDYTLQAGSPAKNAGIDVGYGSSPNIGAL